MHFTKLLIDPPIFAHRGASHYAPENTLAAFLKAKQLGIRWLEFDVMLTEDNEVIVFHDDTLDRTTNDSGYVSELPYSYLKKLSAGSWFAPEFSEEKIPLLSEVIHWMHVHQMSANIEIKSLFDREDITVDKVLEVMQMHWPKDMSPPLLSSYSLNILSRLREKNPTCELGLLMDEWMYDWEDLSDEFQCVSVHPNQRILTPDRVKEIKSTNRNVFTFTVNDINRAREFFSWGVDAIYSDVIVSL